LIEARTKYTKESFREFQRFNLFTGARGAIMIVCLIIIFGAGLISMAPSFASGDPTGSFPAIIFITLGILYLLRPRIAARSAFKRSPALFESGVAYSFSGEFFTETVSGASVSGVSNIKYAALYKAFETKKYFYLYLQPNSAFIIDKTGFTQGTPEELAAILGRAMPGKKFRKYK